MAAVGLLIFAVAALVALVTGLGNSGSDHALTNFSTFGIHVSGSSGRIFTYGAAVGAIAMLGLNMLLAGIGRGFKNRIHNRRELKQEHSHAAELQEERDRLERELQEAQAQRSEVDLRGSNSRYQELADAEEQRRLR